MAFALAIFFSLHIKDHKMAQKKDILLLTLPGHSVIVSASFTYIARASSFDHEFKMDGCDRVSRLSFFLRNKMNMCFYLRAVDGSLLEINS